MDSVTHKPAAPVVLRGCRKIKGCLEKILGERLTDETIYHWAKSRRIRTGRFGPNLTATEESLREEWERRGDRGRAAWEGSERRRLV
jgi:hypothetical protein